jgi:outer membrane protein OmpA-like peptidoglycan-associated protein
MARIVSVALVAAFLVACASTKPHPEVLRVKQDYQAALDDPQIDRKDSLQLLEAEKDIAHAEAANRDKDELGVTHYVYLADMRIRIARLTAETKAANAKAAALAQERPSLRLEARTAEADVATERAAAAEATAVSATRRAEEAERQLNDMEARQTERGYALALGGVHFDFNKTALKPEATRKLSMLAGFLIANPDRDVLVEGFADEVGSDPANEIVSRGRADSVKRYLVANGVGADRIAVKAYGAADPLQSNESVEGRDLNRRAQITILPPGASAADAAQ